MYTHVNLIKFALNLLHSETHPNRFISAYAQHVRVNTCMPNTFSYLLVRGRSCRVFPMALVPER